MRARRSSTGFTLVELLVVIAIIGILAGFIAVGLPRAIRAAKLAATKNNMNQIRTILTTYLTDHGTYPPAYGYLSPIFLSNSHPITNDYPELRNPQDRPGQILAMLGDGRLTEQQTYFLVPWMTFIREHGNLDLYDNWSEGFDTDPADKSLSEPEYSDLTRLEFAPFGEDTGPGNPPSFANFDQLYLGNNGSANTGAVQSDARRQLDSRDDRPFIYLPVNERQVRQFANIVNPGGTNPDPRPFNLSPTQIADIVQQLSFPPPSYDAFALISVGPNFFSGTNGIVFDFGPNTIDFSDFAANPEYPAVYQYHILALAVYYLATRDANNDGELDFDFTARSTKGQATMAMPGVNPRGDGPIIYVGK